MISFQSRNDDPMTHQSKLYWKISNKTISFHYDKCHQVFVLSFHIKMKNILNLTKQKSRHKSSA